MSYTRERDLFINQASKEGLDLATITKLLRYATTLQRLAVARCNGDWPYNGDRDRPELAPHPSASMNRPEDIMARRERWDKQYPTCPKCEASGVAKSAMRRSVDKCPCAFVAAERTRCTDCGGTRHPQICPDCRTQELVIALLNHQTGAQRWNGAITPIFGGDPRGAVLRLSTSSYPYDDSGKNGANGLYVTARER